MDAVSYSDLRQNLKRYLDKVYTDNRPNDHYSKKQ